MSHCRVSVSSWLHGLSRNWKDVGLIPATAPVSLCETLSLQVAVDERVSSMTAEQHGG